MHFAVTNHFPKKLIGVFAVVVVYFLILNQKMHTSLIYIRPYIVTLKSVNLKHWKYFSYNFTSPNNRLTLFLLTQEKRLAHATTKKMFTEATKTNNSCSLCLPSLWYLIRRALETECKVFINLLWPSDSFLSSVGGTRVWDLHEHNSCNLFESYCTVKETSQGFKFPHGLSFQNDGHQMILMFFFLLRPKQEIVLILRFLTTVVERNTLQQIVVFKIIYLLIYHLSLWWTAYFWWICLDLLNSL